MICNDSPTTPKGCQRGHVLGWEGRNYERANDGSPKEIGVCFGAIPAFASDVVFLSGCSASAYGRIVDLVGLVGLETTA